MLYITQLDVKHGLNEITQLVIYIFITLRIYIEEILITKRYDHFGEAPFIIKFYKEKSFPD